MSYDTAEALENALGDELRSKYGGMKYGQLQTVLGKRRKAVLVSRKVCDKWCKKHASPLGKRTTPLHLPEPPRKRRVVTKTPLSSMYPMELDGPQELEEACGHRYRTEVSDLGLGLGQRDMHKRLSVWGYVASQQACRDWLSRYRLGDGAVDGTDSLYALSRQDLQRWFHIDGLTPQQLQERYRKETGVYADPRNLVRWLKAPAQALTVLDENVDMHSHACGEYVLEQLQQGKSPAVVVEQLLSLYLVRATPQRLLAYRRYREESSDYWTEEQLSRLHWEFLYEQVSPCSQKRIWDSLGVERSAVSLRRDRMSHSRRKNRDLNVRVVRVRLCKQIGVAEESVPMGRLSDFFKEHEPYARLPLDNSGVRVVKDSVPADVVSVYGKVLKDKSFQTLDGICYELAVEVAVEHQLVVWPKCAW